MDSLIAAAGRALAAGDPLGALKRVALREDAPALALRGIAMAQLGDFARAKLLLRRAARAFGPSEAVARARCTVAEAEIALVSRDLSWPAKALETARATLEAHGDRMNALYAAYLEIRRLLLLGRLDEAEVELAKADVRQLSPALKTVHELVVAGIAVRRLRTKKARAALFRANSAAHEARIPALVAEAERAFAVLEAPAARLIAADQTHLLRLEEVEAVLASKAFVVDACRRVVAAEGKSVSFSTRPVLFALARSLSEAWPDDVPRNALLERAFGAKVVDESHRARLRVEIARLRKMLPFADISATKRGFALTPRRVGKVIVLTHPIDIDEGHAAVLALLVDGESWSSSALALALAISQRSVQRALDALAAAGKVQPLGGGGRARRWMATPLPGFTTTLLLPAPLPAD
jgi:tetratricopeptide (TPR) repeat protein